MREPTKYRLTIETAEFRENYNIRADGSFLYEETTAPIESKEVLEVQSNVLERYFSAEVVQTFVGAVEEAHAELEAWLDNTSTPKTDKARESRRDLVLILGNLRQALDVWRQANRAPPQLTIQLACEAP